MAGDGVALLVNLSFMLALVVALVAVHSKMQRARGRNLRELASPLLLQLPEYERYQPRTLRLRRDLLTERCPATGSASRRSTTDSTRRLGAHAASRSCGRRRTDETLAFGGSSEASKGCVECRGCTFENFQGATHCVVCGDALTAEAARARIADAAVTPKQRRAR